MKSRALQCLLFACLFAGLGTSAQAQERSVRSFAQRLTERVSDHKPWRSTRRVTTNVSSSRYRGSYGRTNISRRSYGRNSKVWVPAHFENVASQIFVPERFERIWVPAVYETRYRSCGSAYQLLIRAGHWKRICHPAHYETRYKETWIVGRYETLRGFPTCRL